MNRKVKNSIYYGIFLLSTLFGIAMLGLLLYNIVSGSIGWLDWQFITNFASRFPARAGIKAALSGTLLLMAVTAPVAFILGVGTAIYLEEYAEDNWFTKLIKINISNLAGVPSIVYGILGLAVFVRFLGLGRSVLAGGLTMALLVLPIIVVSTQEAIRSVSDSLRHGGYALGATRWQVIRSVVLPSALPGILTGTILALSRAIGETAPLIMIGAVSFVAFTPDSLFSQFTVLPIQIFNWTSRPQADFQHVAAAGIVVLMSILLLMNAGAVLLRNRYQKRY